MVPMKCLPHRSAAHAQSITYANNDVMVTIFGNRTCRSCQLSCLVLLLKQWNSLSLSSGMPHGGGHHGGGFHGGGGFHHHHGGFGHRHHHHHHRHRHGGYVGVYGSPYIYGYVWKQCPACNQLAVESLENNMTAAEVLLVGGLFCIIYAGTVVDLSLG